MNCRRVTRSTSARPPSFEAVRSKLMRIVCRQEQLKVSFRELRSQIGTGLLEAEDVFVSLAMQLMKLVGLKTAEMAEERRFSTIVSSFDSSLSQPEDYIEKATKAGNELMKRQKLQLTQLISLLKKIEAQVNSSQNSIFQDLANQKAFIRKLFVNASSFVSSANQSNRSNNDLSPMMLKILKVTFDQVGAALGSVEAGIGDLIAELADKMCTPMVQFAHGLKAEMETGTCSCLLEVVKEMHDTMQIRRLELEEARNQAMVAEQSRIEALSRLTKSEETAKKLTMSLRLLTEDTTGLEKETKSLQEREDQVKDERLLWELVRQKRKSVSERPKELVGAGTSSKKVASKRVIPLLTHNQRPPKRAAQLKRADLQSQPINSSIKLLASSPPAKTQKVLCGKRITP